MTYTFTNDLARATTFENSDTANAMMVELNADRDIWQVYGSGCHLQDVESGYFCILDDTTSVGFWYA